MLPWIDVHDVPTARQKCGDYADSIAVNPSRLPASKERANV